MPVYPAGVAAISDVWPPCVGQLDVRAGNKAAVGEVSPVFIRVDFDRLFGGIDDVDVVDEGVLSVPIRGGDHVDRVGVGPLQGQVGDRHIGSSDGDHLCRLIVAIYDRRLTIPAGRAQCHAGGVDPQVGPVQFISAIGNADGSVGL